MARTFGQGTRALAEDKFQQTKRGDKNHHERLLRLSPVDQAFTIYTRNGKGNKPKGPTTNMDLATKDQAISTDLTGKTKTKTTPSAG